GQRRNLWKRRRSALAPNPEREKKMPDPAADSRPATARRRPGAGRDRPAVVPASAGGVVEARGGGPGLAERPERPAGHLRGEERPHGGAVVAAAGEGAQRGLPGVPRGGPVGLPGLARGA